MSKSRIITLLNRIEAHAWNDATDCRLADAWRNAAARVSGNMSMKAELLAESIPTRKRRIQHG